MIKDVCFIMMTYFVYHLYLMTYFISHLHLKSASSLSPPTEPDNQGDRVCTINPEISQGINLLKQRWQSI